MRSSSKIRRDLRAMMDQLAMVREMGYEDGIRYALREIRGLEEEMIFNRYGRTDVQ